MGIKLIVSALRGIMAAMDIQDTSDVIQTMNECAGGDPETWRIETFRMHRLSEKHGYQDVTVEIWDRGSKITPRYHVSAKTSEGQHCAGNSGDDLNEVIRLVHWYELDR